MIKKLIYRINTRSIESLFKDPLISEIDNI